MFRCGTCYVLQLYSFIIYLMYLFLAYLKYVTITSVIYLFNVQLFYFPTDDELNLLLAPNSKVINK